MNTEFHGFLKPESFPLSVFHPCKSVAERLLLRSICASGPTNIQQTGNELATQSNDATESFFGLSGAELVRAAHSLA